MRFRIVYKYVIVLHTHVCTFAYKCDRIQAKNKYQLNTIESRLDLKNMNFNSCAVK